MMTREIKNFCFGVMVLASLAWTDLKKERDFYERKKERKKQSEKVVI